MSSACRERRNRKTSPDTTEKGFNFTAIRFRFESFPFQRKSGEGKSSLAKDTTKRDFIN